MTITVYNISGSPMGWRVLLGLELKGLEYEVVYLNGSDKEHKKEAFLELNPHGEVPVLKFENTIKRESLAILGWLDQQFPEKPIFGRTPAEIHTVWTVATRHNDYLLRATNYVVFPAFSGPDGQPGVSEAGVHQLELASELLKDELQALEQRLSRNAYLCGEQPSAADAVAFPDVGRVMRAISTKPKSMKTLGFGDFDLEFPNIARWRDQITNLPGHQKTVPPHWKL